MTGVGAGVCVGKGLGDDGDALACNGDDVSPCPSDDEVDEGPPMRDDIFFFGGM